MTYDTIYSYQGEPYRVMSVLYYSSVNQKARTVTAETRYLFNYKGVEFTSQAAVEKYIDETLRKVAFRGAVEKIVDEE